MRVHILIDEAAEEDYRRLPPDVRERVKQRIFALGSDPLPGNARQLSGDLQGLCRLRVGDYRIVYELDMAAQSLTIIAIADRAHVYDVARRRRP
ncbi:MAG: type II toxin-antitoxin system RelE/ParE family toxin [Armatimonadetes bacterium]|nr:type II toxin-antitoxin system RelE/ParE family toxin [Armatimonadota bacterium]